MDPLVVCVYGADEAPPLYGTIRYDPIRLTISTLCLKNDTDVTHYKFNAHQPILVIFGRDAAERICYRTVI